MIINHICRIWGSGWWFTFLKKDDDWNTLNVEISFVETFVVSNVAFHRAVSDATPHSSLHASHDGGHFWRPGGADSCRPGLRLWSSLTWGCHDGRSLCSWLWHWPRCACRIPNQSWRLEKLLLTCLWLFFLKILRWTMSTLWTLMSPTWAQTGNKGWILDPLLLPFLGCLTLKYVKFFHVRVDTVVMNPPFGTKHNKGLDMKFLQVGNHHYVFLLMHLSLDWLGNGLQSCVFAPQKFNQRSCLVQSKGVGGRRKVRLIC